MPPADVAPRPELLHAASKGCDPIVSLPYVKVARASSICAGVGTGVSASV